MEGLYKERYETERLYLKVLDESYAHVSQDFNIRNREFLKEWEPVRNNDFYTLEYQSEMLSYDYENFQNGALLRLWLFKKDDTNFDRTIGSIAFSNIVRGAFLSCHLGYRMDKDEINHGYVTEAIKKGISIIFNDYELHRIEANIMPKNTRSLRVVEKLGFREEGLARKYLKIDGQWEDHIHMVLLNDKV